MNTRFFTIAKHMSYKSPHEFKHGCVIVKGSRIISKGYNSNKTHTKAPCPFKTIHAESHALLSIKRSKTMGATAYVYRGTKDGLNADSKPCIYCESMLRSAGIKKVYFTTSKYPYFGVIKF